MNISPWRKRESGSMTPFGSGAFGDLGELMNRLWNNGGGELAGHLPEIFRGRPVPAVNVSESKKEYRVTMDCPGLDEDDLHVEALGDQLVISGERKWEDETEDQEFRRVESQYGRFERSVQLPTNAQLAADHIVAKYKKGVLTVRIPKAKDTAGSRIPVAGE